MRGRDRSSRVVVAAAIAGLAAVLALYGALCARHAAQGRLDAKEGVWALAGREALLGRLPYRDFAHDGMPLEPYLAGLVTRVGGDIVAARAINAALGGLSLVVVAVVIRRRLRRWEPALAAVFCVGANPHWAALQASGTANGAAGLLVALCAGAALGEGSLLARAAAFSILSGLCVGLDLSTAAPLAALAIGLVAGAAGARARLAIAIALIISAAAVTLPFAAASPRGFAYGAWTLSSAAAKRGELACWVRWWSAAGAPLLLLLAGTTVLPRLAVKRDLVGLAAMAAGLAAAAAPLFRWDADGTAVAPAVGVIAIGATIALWSLVVDRPSPFRHVVWLLPLLSLYHDAPTLEATRADEGARGLSRRLDEVAGPGPVLTSLPLVAVDSKRRVLEGTELGARGVMASSRADTAKALRTTTLAALAEAVEARRAAAVVLENDRPAGGFGRVAPTMRRAPRKEIEAFTQGLRRRYRRVFENELGAIWILR